jgi:hypothetical protein
MGGQSWGGGTKPPNGVLKPKYSLRKWAESDGISSVSNSNLFDLNNLSSLFVFSLYVDSL